MRKSCSVVVVCVCVTMAMVMGWFGAGCDTVTKSDSAITVNPPLLTATGRVAVVITVDDSEGDLYLPLNWSVSDASLGTITEQGALTALYKGNARVGVNTVTVKDQANAEGFTVINHVPSDGMVLSPTTNTLRGAGAQMQFSVTPDNTLALPLIWTSSNQGLGVIVSAGGYNAVYQSTGAYGDNFIVVRDQLGASASAIVYHR